MNLLISKLLNLAKSERMEEVVLVNNNLSKTVELSLLPFEGRTYEKDIKLSYEIEDNINISTLEINIIKILFYGIYLYLPSLWEVSAGTLDW